jgi:hypothetical protein
MKKSRKFTGTKLALLMSQLVCLSAYAQSNQFPSDGSANSFNSTLPQTVKNSAQQTHDLAVSYVNFMMTSLKLSQTQAVGVVGNLMYESGGAQGLNSGWQQSVGSQTIGSVSAPLSPQSGFGIAQWEGNRQQALINFAANGQSICTIGTSLPGSGRANLPNSSQLANFGFLLEELQCNPSYSPTVTALQSQTTILGAVCAFEKLYEQPATDPESATRLQYANTVAGWVNLTPQTSPASSGDACAYYTVPGSPGSSSSTTPPSQKTTSSSMMLPSNPPASGPAGSTSTSDGQTISTNTGTGQFYVITNSTGQTQTFAFSANSNAQTGASNDIFALMTLGPGQTATFESGPNVPGIRIQTSGADGQTNPNQALYEDTVETNPMGGGDIVHNPDVSDVAGNVGYDGKVQNITVNDGTRTIGNGTTTGAYQYATQDTDPNQATNPMNMALDPSNTYHIVFSE